MTILKPLFSPSKEIANHKKRAWLKEFATNPHCLGLIVSTCTCAKVAVSTFYKWQHEDALFAAEVKLAKEFAIERLENRLDQAALNAKSPNVIAAIFRLKGLRPDLYRERHEITLSRVEREARIAELLALRSTPLPATARGESSNGDIDSARAGCGLDK